MARPLRVLMIEDSADDALLLVRELRRGSYELEYERVEDEAGMAAALERGGWDVVLADFNLPQFGGPAALQMLREHDPDLPFIIVSGTIDEEAAVAALQAGAHNFVTRTKLARLVPVIEREIRDAGIRREHARAQAALRKSEERFRTLIENASDLITILEADGTIRYESPPIKRLLGYEPEELVGRNVFVYVHEEDVAEVQRRFQHLLAHPDETVGVSFRFRHKDGSWRVLEAEGQSLLGNPTVGGIVVNSRDVTERTRAEELLRIRTAHLDQLFWSAPEGVVLLDMEDRVLRANPEFLRMFDYPSEEEVLGRTINELIVPQERTEEAGDFSRRVLAGEHLACETVRRRSDGSPVPVSILAVPIHDETGGVSVYGIYRDISARKRSEEALRASEERFRSLIENALDIITVLSPGGTIRYESPSVERVLGYAPEELAGRSVFEFLHPEDQPNVRLLFAAGPMHVGTTEISEFRFRHRDGSWRVLEGIGRFVIQPPDGPGIVVNSRDITERKQAEAREHVFSRVLEDARSEIYLFDAATLRFLEVNRGARENLGYTMEELHELTPLDLKPEFTPATFERLVTPLRAGEREVVHFETVHRRKDGSLYPVDVHLQLSTAGGPPLFMALIMDVTERRKAERALRESETRFRQVIEHAADAIFLHDLKGRIVDVNQHACETLGYTREELLTLSMADVETSHVPAMLESTWSEVITGAPLTLEGIHRRKDGTMFPVEVRIGRFLSGDRPLVLALVRDVTERRRAEERLRGVQRIEAVGRLAGGIAHDFNNVLTAIKGNVHFLLEDLPEDHPSREDAEEISKSTERAARLTSQLLAFSRKQVLQSKVLDLNALVREMKGMLRPLIGEDVQLVTELAPDLTCIKADPSQVEQIIANLVVNARDAMPAGGILSIRTSNVDLDGSFTRLHPEMSAGAYVKLVVSDTGIGMDQETLSHVFEPFFTTKEPGKGTGMGLSTVYGIAKQSGGYVYAGSVMGEGSSFTIYLPQADGEPDLPAAAPARTSAGAGETVLLVEDDREVRELARRILERVGYHVLEATNGAEALQLATEHSGPIHLLLTDVVMPGLNGKEVAEQIAQVRPGLPAVFMSGYTEDQQVLREVMEARLPFLQKPFEATGLASTLREVLDRTVVA